MTTSMTLREIDGEPRVRDHDLAKSLRLVKPHSIRTKIIRTHRAELELYGPIVSHREKLGGRGRPSEPFYLNEHQSILCAVFARTDEAVVVRKQLIDLFVAYRNGKVASAPAQIEYVDDGLISVLDYQNVIPNRKWKPSFKSGLGMIATNLAIQSKTALGKADRQFLLDGELKSSTVNTYPKALLDTAYTLMGRLKEVSESEFAF